MAPRLFALLGALLLVAAACTGERPTLSQEVVVEPATETPTPAPLDEEPTPSPEPTPSSAPSATPDATPTPTDVLVECVATLDRRTRLGQLLLPLATQADLALAGDLAEAGSIAGITLMGEVDGDLGADLSTLHSRSTDVPLIVASDEEGGSVQRLAPLLGELPAAATVATSSTPEAVRAATADYGAEMLGLGVTMALAPVLDIGAGPGIGDRSYSNDPAVVIDYGRAAATGFADAGVIAVYKHFPGHGRASADSHDTLPTTPRLEELEAADLLPFQALLGMPGTAVMVGHLSVPGLSDETPTSISPATHRYLREELGYDGLVLSDAMNMGAIVSTYGVVDAAERAIAVGTDLVLLGALADVEPVLVRLEEALAAGRLTDEAIDDSVLRVLEAKGVDPCSL